MNVTLKLFAVAKQLAGADTLEIDLPPEATIADLRAAVAAQYPALEYLVRRAMFARNADYAADQAIIQPGDEIACIPPVSGG